LPAADEARKPVVFQRLTVTPSAFFSIRLASRSFFMWVAMRLMASSQEMRFHSLLPGSRTSGNLSRLGLLTMSIRPAPLGHSVPRFTGLSGSPSMWMMSAFAFLDLSPVV
jgi:hypothetical protein